MFDLVYDFCMFVVEQLDPVLSIGAFYKLPMSDIRPVILFGILGSYLFLHIWENILLKLGK